MNESLYLYHLTLRRPDTISAATVLTSPHEIFVAARGQWLEAMEFPNGDVIVQSRINLFQNITSLTKIEVEQNEYIVVTTDIFIILYEFQNKEFKEFSKLPIKDQIYSAADARGRVILTSGIDKSRNAIVVFPDEGLTTPVNTPLPNMICYSIVPLDRGYNNPAFYFIERTTTGSKCLTLYEFNLGLNNLMKLWSVYIDMSADHLCAFPASGDVKSGCIYFTKTQIFWLNLNGETLQTLDIELEVLVASLIKIDETKWVILAQLIDNSLVELKIQDGEMVLTPLILPSLVPKLSSIHPLKSGYLWLVLQDGSGLNVAQVTNYEPFKIEVISELRGVSPVTNADLQKTGTFLIDQGQEQPHLTKLEFGISFDTLAESPLPSRPLAIFTTKTSSKSKNDQLIAISFPESTVLLAVDDEGSVEETTETETGLLLSRRTLGLFWIGSGVVQLFDNGFKFVHELTKQSIMWSTPSKTTIMHYAHTPTQLALGLNNHKIVYFELQNNELVESQQKLQLPSVFTTFTFSETLEHELKAKHLLVSCEDMTIKHYKTSNLGRDQITPLNGEPVSSVLNKNGKLFIGHEDGKLSVIDSGGCLTRKIGSQPVRLVSLYDSVAVLSSRNWLVTLDNKLVNLRAKFKSICQFVSEDIANGVAAIDANNLLIMSIQFPNDKILSTKKSLELKSVPLTNIWKQNQVFTVCSTNITNTDMQLHANTVVTDGNFKNGINMKFEDEMECLVTCSGNFVTVYKYTSGEVGSGSGYGLEPLHTTQLTQPATAMAPLENMLLISQPKEIILMKLGKKQLLKQAYFAVPDVTQISVMKVVNNKVFIGDAKYSVTILDYNNSSGKFELVNKDPVPRSVKHMLLLPNNLICLADLNGNIAVLSEDMKLLCHFYVPDAITSLNYGSVNPAGSTKSVFYTGILGTIGMLTPFGTLEEANSMFELENEQRKTHSWHLEFRSLYNPVRNVIDGDLCELNNANKLEEMRYRSGVHSM